MKYPADLRRGFSPATGKFTLRLQHGATLMEVLVSVAVASIGLLGATGVLALTARINGEAYLTAQAGFIAQGLIDSMHINPGAVTDGHYDGAYRGDHSVAPDCLSHGCSADARADYDRSRFDRALRTTLGGATASVKCTAVTARAPTDDAGRCRIEIEWPRGDATVAGPRQPLVWIFTP